MKGLLVKDLKLIKMQRNFFILMIVISIGIAFSTEDISFAVGYLGFILPLFSLSTISYDEFDNGSAFLFTLPISRKGYVIEKYCFGILLGIASLALALVIALCMGTAMETVNFSDTLISAPFIFSGVMVSLAVTIPIQIKFGAEKSRIAMIAACSIVCVLSYAVVKVSNWLGFDTTALGNNLSKLNVWVVIACAVVSALCILLLSMRISISIIRKKEF